MFVDDQYFLSMETLYKDLDAATVLSVIRAKSPKERMKNYLQFAKGLKGVHSKGIVHADLKPENIMAKDK